MHNWGVFSSKKISRRNTLDCIRLLCGIWQSITPIYNAHDWFKNKPKKQFSPITDESKLSGEIFTKLFFDLIEETLSFYMAVIFRPWGRLGFTLVISELKTGKALDCGRYVVLLIYQQWAFPFKWAVLNGFVICFVSLRFQNPIREQPVGFAWVPGSPAE